VFRRMCERSSGFARSVWQAAAENLMCSINLQAGGNYRLRYRPMYDDSIRENVSLTTRVVYSS
jgi:hypothetical protein